MDDKDLIVKLISMNMDIFQNIIFPELNIDEIVNLSKVNRLFRSYVITFLKIKVGDLYDYYNDPKELDDLNYYLSIIKSGFDIPVFKDGMVIGLFRYVYDPSMIISAFRKYLIKNQLTANEIMFINKKLFWVYIIDTSQKLIENDYIDDKKITLIIIDPIISQTIKKNGRIVNWSIIANNPYEATTHEVIRALTTGSGPYGFITDKDNFFINDKNKKRISSSIGLSCQVFTREEIINLLKMFNIDGSVITSRKDLCDKLREALDKVHLLFNLTL